MNRINVILLGLLGLQVGAISLSGMSSEPVAAFQRSLVVSGMVAEEIVGIDIASGEESVRLERASPTAPWTVASASGWRADGKKVDKALGEVLGLETADLISSTANHHVDLKVGDSDFERKITLTGAAGTREVVFGTSASGSGVHLRRGDETDVFAARDFSTWTLGTAANSWIDRNYLELPRDQISGVTIEAGVRVALSKTDDGWTVVVDDAEPAPAVQTVVDSILGKLERLTLSEVTSTTPPAPVEGDVRVVATVEGGPDGPARTVSLHLVPKAAEPGEDDAPPADPDAGPERWFVRSDSESHTVEVGRWAVRPLVEIDPSTIVDSTEKAEDIED